jgi:Lon protease-like protein
LLPIVVGLGGLALVVAALSVVLAGGSGDRLSIEVTGQPRLRVDRETVDLGDIQLGRTVDASFVLSNVGDEPLKIAEAPFIEVVEGC